MDTPLTTRNSYYLELSTIFHFLATHNYETVSHSKGTGVKTEKSFSDFDSQECVLFGNIAIMNFASWGVLLIN